MHLPHYQIEIDADARHYVRRMPMITDPEVSGVYALAATLEDHSPASARWGITAKSQARNVTGPITFTQSSVYDQTAAHLSATFP
jgi:hypothetical protein